MNNSSSRLSGDDKILYRRILDIISISQRKNYSKFSNFLNPHEQQIALLATKETGFSNYCFFGGNVRCERKIFCALSSYDNYINENIYPIDAFTLLFRSQDNLSHRDFLGLFMSKLIKREAIGDIFVGGGKCVVYVLYSVSDLIEDTNKIANVGVKVIKGVFGSCPSSYEKEEYSAVVSSLRSDCIVSAIAGVSREKGADLIAKGLVCINYEKIKEYAKNINNGDVISIRGYGKFLFNAVGRKTKNGRNAITYSKYK